MISCDWPRTRYGGDIDKQLLELSWLIAEVYTRMRKEGYDQEKADYQMFMTFCLGLYGAERIMETEDQNER